jgi:hypothetical protein
LFTYPQSTNFIFVLSSYKEKIILLILLVELPTTVLIIFGFLTVLDKEIHISDKFINRQKLGLLSWLNKPYPLIQTLQWKLAVIFGSGIFVTAFLWLYQPFGATDIKEYHYLFLAGFGASVALGLSIGYLILPKLAPALFNQEKWQIKKEILFLLTAFLIISVLNYLYNSIVGAQIAPQHSLLEFIGITTAVGVFPVFLLVFLIEFYMSRRNSTEAKSLNENLRNNNTAEDVEFTIIPETIRSRHLMLKLDDFLFAKSDNNYTTFYFFKEGLVNKSLVRVSLKNVEHQLTPYDAIIRCHNSYMVNKNKIVDIKGNARSLYLRLEAVDEKIPVSRGFDKEKLLG